MSFLCLCCGNVYPDLLRNEHHVHPLEYGGKDISQNIVVLCAGCHQLLHYLAYKKVKNQDTESSIYEYLKTIGCPDIKNYASHLSDYVGIIASKYILHKQGIITSEKKDKRVQLYLPQDIKELLRIDGKASGFGLEKNIQVILIRHLIGKHPGLKDALEQELLKVLQG